MRYQKADVLRSLWPPLFAIVSTVLLILIAYVEQHADTGILSPVFVIFCLIYVGLGVFFVAGIFINMLKRKFILATSMLLASSIMTTSIVRAQELTERIFQGIDMLRFAVSRDYYLQTDASQKDRTQRFSWGSGGFLGTNFFYTLIYQPQNSSDSPALPKRKDCRETVSEIRKDFYIGNEVCQ